MVLGGDNGPQYCDSSALSATCGDLKFGNVLLDDDGGDLRNASKWEDG